MVSAFALALTTFVAAAFVPLLAPGDVVPAIPLVDQSGNAFSVARLRGNAVVIGFVYTRCPDPRMCPLVSSKFARLQAGIGTSKIRLLEVTLDPAFDTPAVLRRYGHAYGQNPQRWTLAGGTAPSIRDLSERLGIASQWTQPGTLVHTEALVILDGDNRIARIIDGNTWTPGAALAAAREATGERPAPLAYATLWLTSAVQSCGGGVAGVTVVTAIGVTLLLAIAFATILVRAFVANP